MSNLDDGIIALRTGEKEKARALIAKAIKEEPQNEKAWMWMFNASVNDKEKIACLKQILQINPKNTKALAMLENLTNSVDSFSEQSAQQQLPKSQENLNSPVVTPKPPKNNSIAIAIVSIFSICIVSFCCILLTYKPASSENTPSINISNKTSIRYIIKGSATSALITYFNEQGGTEQVTQNIPFEKKMSVEPFSMLSLVAQNQGSGSITCEIWVNDVKTKTSTSTAQYGVVTCSDIAK